MGPGRPLTRGPQSLETPGFRVLCDTAGLAGVKSSHPGAMAQRHIRGDRSPTAKGRSDNAAGHIVTAKLPNGDL